MTGPGRSSPVAGGPVTCTIVGSAAVLAAMVAGAAAVVWSGWARSVWVAAAGAVAVAAGLWVAGRTGSPRRAVTVAVLVVAAAAVPGLVVSQPWLQGPAATGCLCRVAG